jgi:uncharacterized protein (TIGR02611 family)
MENQESTTATRFSSYHKYRSWIETKHSSVRLMNKALVTLTGLVVIVVGLILVPLPGPGWLIVFFGLTILGLEFPLIRRFTHWIGAKVRRLWSWFKQRFLSK